MNLIAFCEGAWAGYPGIVCVPTIHSSTAARGHHSILVLGGASPLGREQFQVPDVEGALARKQGEGTFGVINVSARTRWAIAPSMLWRFHKAVRESDFVSLHSLYSFPVFAGYLLARLYRRPFGIWLHGVLAPFQRQVSPRKKWFYNRLVADRILRNASVLFFSAEGERAEVSALRLSAPSVIIPDGFDAAEFAALPPRGRFRDRFLSGHKGPLILFLARINAKKGLDILISAMKKVIAQYPDARLAIVGPPDPVAFGKQVSEWIAASGIDASIVVTGPADVTMRFEAFADADVYALPSHAENFGFSVFEAMACAVPVVVSETINYAEGIAQSGSGLAVSRTPDAVAAAIIGLLNDPEKRRAMGVCGKVFVQNYSLEETGRKVVDTIQAVVDCTPFPENVAPMNCYAVSNRGSA